MKISAGLLILLQLAYEFDGLTANNTFYLRDSTSSVELKGEHIGSGINLSITKDGEIKLKGFIHGSFDLNKSTCYKNAYCIFKSKNSDSLGTLEINSIIDGFNILASHSQDVLEHGYDLNVTDTNWFGGPELTLQYWPLEKVTLSGDEAYVPKQDKNSGVTERYWLNSKGSFIFIDDQSPLFVDQNNRGNGTVYFIAKLTGPYVNRDRNFLNYTVMVKNNTKEAHLYAVNNFLGKPRSHPNEKMIKEPIWTTWAKYKRDISDATVMSFAKEIRSHNYTSGQLEIDDNWEKCYGAQEFNTDKFGKISSTIEALKELDYRVTLWIHPFVDEVCTDRSNEGKSKGYFVKNINGSDHAEWWNSDKSHQIDFTNSEAVLWFSNRLKALQESPGIDSFKFDAGEVSWGPQPPIFPNHENVYDWPNILTKDYIQAVAKFGDLIEFRSGWRTQHLSNFIRIIDKDSNWSFYNGLPTLITTLLTLNMVGYGMVLPDMIGGNGYSDPPTAELLVRWTQANTFMPAMQFSYLPWDFKDVDYDIEGVVRKYVDLHAEYTPYILKAMEKNIETGAPVNAPIWWLDPTDKVALATWDEFLLGEDILVAPVIEEKATQRSVYLPKGTWIDGNNSTTVYDGPALISYSAPIDVLPWFIRKD